MATPDETREALIEALLRLVRSRSLGEITVREIAREAGVNHGLVHRYFGSKDNLVQAATRRISDALHSNPDRRIGATTWRFFLDHPELVRVLAQACLEGRQELLDAAAPTPQHLEQIIAPIRAWMEELPVSTDPHVLNGLALSAILGWLLFRPLLDAGFGLPDDADPQVEELLELLDLALRQADG